MKKLKTQAVLETKDHKMDATPTTPSIFPYSRTHF